MSADARALAEDAAAAAFKPASRLESDERSTAVSSINSIRRVLAPLEAAR